MSALSGMNAGSDPISFGVSPAGLGMSASRSINAATASRSPSRASLLLVGEAELFEHPLDAVLDGQELAAAGLLGDVEVAVRAGQPVWAFGEEVVAAVALAQVVVLPGSSPLAAAPVRMLSRSMRTWMVRMLRVK